MKLKLHQRIHFIGIGGCGMSALAKILILQGYRVSGSDLRESPMTMRLRDMGATVCIGHHVRHMRLVDVVIVSTAIMETNPELSFALSEEIPVYKRAELLNFLMGPFPKRVSVAGTHGKTTTTGMLAQVLMSVGRDPTYMLGGELVNKSCGGHLGRGDIFLAESDESDGSFLCLTPTVGILLNLELEHMDYYQTQTQLEAAFSTYMDGVFERSGTLFVNYDDKTLMSLLSQDCLDSVVTYGLSDQADFFARDIDSSVSGIAFDVIHKDVCLSRISLKLYGIHNVYNALAVFAYVYREGIPVSKLADAFLDFEGTKRRLQCVGFVHGIHVYDDYAHHPTEIQVTIKGIKASRESRVIAIFQPHRYTRTRDFLDRFITCFDDADQVIITDIYAANEAPIDGVSSKVISEALRLRGRDVIYLPKKSEIPPFLLETLMPNDLVLTMGAGDIHTVSKELVVQLKSLERLNLEEISY